MRVASVAITLALAASLSSAQPRSSNPRELPPSRPRPLIVDTSRGVGAVPGRVTVVLDPDQWKPEFSIADRSGIDRLRDGTPLVNLLRCRGVERVMRTFANVEIATGTHARVVTFAEAWKRAHMMRRKRPNERAFAPPDLPDAPNSFELKFPDSTDLDDLVARLRATYGVRSAEVVRYPAGQWIPNDPGWLASGTPGFDSILQKGRWGFHNENLGSEFLAGFDIDAPEAWDVQRGDPHVVVAVIDTVIDVTHEDLYLNVFLNNGEVPQTIVNAFKGASTEDGLPDELTFYDLNVPSTIAALAAMNPPLKDTNGNGRIDGADVVAWWSDGIDNDGNGGCP